MDQCQIKELKLLNHYKKKIYFSCDWSVVVILCLRVCVQVPMYVYACMAIKTRTTKA